MADLGSMIAPRSVVVVGASDRSRWSSALLENLDRHGYRGALHLVNRRGGTVAGRPAAVSCAALGERADLGVVLVPAGGAADAVADLRTAGVGSALVLTSGFAETGTAGAAQQAELLRVARAAGIRLLGPNSLGFMNFVDRAVAWAAPVTGPSRCDGIGLVSQSGATAYFLTGLAHQQDVPLSHVVATGNEADLDATAFARHLVADPHTRAVALFLETVRDPAGFAAAARAAADAGKPLVVLKVGTSPVTAASAMAHTGALVGDDRVFDGICRQHGVVRVRSLEELLTTADVIGRTGRLRAGGLAVVSNSGGVGEIVADAAHALGVDVPAVPAAAAPQLQAALPAFATPHNPLDVTGAIAPERFGDAVAVLAAQPEYAAVLVGFYPVPATAAPAGAGDERTLAIYTHVSAAQRAAPVPGFVVSHTNAALTAAGRASVAERGIPYLACGIDRALTGLAAAMRWSRWHRERPATSGAEPGEPLPDRPRSEPEVLDLLARCGVPVVPATLAVDEDAAVASAAALDGPAVLKIASPDLPHKTDIGGVALGVSGEDAVRTAYRTVRAAGRAGARIDGVLVAPQRKPGVELFVGCTVDPLWGPVLAVGLGGIWVEAFADVAVAALPVTAGEVRAMLAGLQGARLLSGTRGLPAADLDAVADAVVRIGDAALRLGPDLAALDVNPLWVRGGRVEALDGLAEWR